jgi:predicted phage tail protein
MAYSKSDSESAGCFCVILGVIMGLAADYEGWNPWLWGGAVFAGSFTLFAVVMKVDGILRPNRIGRCPRCGAPVKQHTDEL